MELLSDFGRVSNLLNNDNEITGVEFSEDRSYMNTNTNMPMDSKQYDQNPITGGENDSNRNKDIANTTWMNKEFEQQFGGENDNLNYLDNYVSAQYKLDANSYEKEFRDIFNKARDYRERVTRLRNMAGGQEENVSSEEKKKKPPSKALVLMLMIAKTISDSGKYPDVKRKDLMRIAGMIMSDAKKDMGTTEITDEVHGEALRKAKDPAQYIERVRSMVKDQAETRPESTDHATVSESRRRRPSSQRSRSGMFSSQKNSYAFDEDDLDQLSSGQRERNLNTTPWRSDSRSRNNTDRDSKPTRSYY